jgi:hypothetical protein
MCAICEQKYFSGGQIHGTVRNDCADQRKTGDSNRYGSGERVLDAGIGTWKLRGGDPTSNPFRRGLGTTRKKSKISLDIEQMFVYYK